MRTANASDPRASPRPALLLIDFMNPLDFDGADDLAPRAVAAAQRAAILKSRMRARRAPVIYANDNFGRWESNFEAIVNYCKKLGGAPAKLASTLAPSPGDRSVLKPRHSAFFGTPLEFLLDLLVRPTAEHLRYADYHYAEFLSDAPLKVPAAILNDYYRAWGHQFVYDRQSLEDVLQRAGFTQIEEFPINVSKDDHLCGLENVGRMPEGLLALSTMTFEGVKPA